MCEFEGRKFVNKNKAKIEFIAHNKHKISNFQKKIIIIIILKKKKKSNKKKET